VVVLVAPLTPHQGMQGCKEEGVHALHWMQQQQQQQRGLQQLLLAAVRTSTVLVQQLLLLPLLLLRVLHRMDQIRVQGLVWVNFMVSMACLEAAWWVVMMVLEFTLKCRGLMRMWRVGCCRPGPAVAMVLQPTSSRRCRWAAVKAACFRRIDQEDFDLPLPRPRRPGHYCESVLQFPATDCDQ